MSRLLPRQPREASWLMTPSSRHALVSLLAAPILAAFFLVSPSNAQDPQIAVLVHDAVTMERLGGTVVSSIPGGTTGTTGSRGECTLSVPAGRCVLQFSRIGYTRRVIDTAVTEGDTLHLVVPLAASSLLIDEVTVVAGHSPLRPLPGVGGTVISPRQIEHIGGTFGDALKALHTLPGVTSNNEMSSRFSVRGGGTDQNLILLGGVQVLEPFHVKESPNTSLSIVNMELLRSIIFIPGGFTARYGDRLSSVLDMEYREGNRDRFAGQVAGSLTDGAITLEGPLFTTGSALLSFRTTYSDYIANYLADGSDRAPSFFDVQGTAGFDLGKVHHITAQLLVGRDRTSGIANGNYGSSLVSVSSRHLFSQESMLHTSFSLYREYEQLSRTLSSSPMPASPTRIDEDTRLSEIRLEMDQQLAPWYRINVGAEVQHHNYRQEHRIEPGGLPEPRPQAGARLAETSDRIGLHAENIFQATTALLVNAGLRADRVSLTGETRLSPRLLAAYHFPGGPTVTGACGIYYQSATHDELLAASAALLPPQRMQRAVHYVLGLQHQLRSDVAVRLDVYHKVLHNLISFQRLRSGDIIHSARNDARGNATGLEMELTVTDERVMAWVNLALMRAREINMYDNRGWRFAPNDQMKTVTAIFEYRMADRWAVNLRALYGSGYAYGGDLPGVHDTREHYPDYKRADARINFTFPLAGLNCLSFLEVMNLFNFRNVRSFSTAGENAATPDFNLLLPRVVNIGLQVRF